MKRTASENVKLKSSIARNKRTIGKSFVMCVDNSGYEASLEFGKAYVSLPTDRRAPVGWLRIVDESGEDYLYDGTRFVRIELPPKAKRAFAAKAEASSPSPAEVVG